MTEGAPEKPDLCVLLVEDSPRIAERMRELLSLEPGVRILATVDEEGAAIKALREMPVDLLILDLQLKVGTGFGVLEAVGASRPTTVVMTNYALPQYRARAKEFGVEYFLNKASDFEKIPEILTEVRNAMR